MPRAAGSSSPSRTRRPLRRGGLTVAAILSTLGSLAAACCRAFAWPRSSVGRGGSEDRLASPPLQQALSAAGSAAAAAAPRPPGQGAHRDVRRVDAVRLSARGGDAGEGPAAEQHNAYQAGVFDEKASFFASEAATPPAVVPRLQRIAHACKLGPDTSLLDVATGTGALLPFYRDAGQELRRVTGVDLSEGMLGYAKERFPEAEMLRGDILTFTDPQARRYDRAVFNACFGNILDRVAVLRHVSESLLAPAGLIVISHPLGRKWLLGLQEQDPKMVVNPLPQEEELRAWVDGQLPGLQVVSVEDEDDYYCAVLQRT